ncbi:MAG: hypothetical protein MUF22_02690 [Chitinispirillaceae bacterium]|nr:hypothetical protein [Chitinispirillaceae bacterium]
MSARSAAYIGVITVMITFHGLLWDAQAAGRQMSPEEITTALITAQRRADSLAAARGQLSMDSARIAGSSRTDAGAQQIIARLESLIREKTSAAQGIRTQYNQAKSDSMTAAQAAGDKFASIRGELSRLRSAIAASSAALSALTSRRTATGATDGSYEARAVSALQAQIARHDSAVYSLQNELAGMTTRRNRLSADSADIVKKRDYDRNQYQSQLRSVDENIARCDSAIGSTAQKLASERAEKSQRAARIRESASTMARQLREINDAVAQIRAEVESLTDQLQRTTQNSDAARQNYEQLRAPYSEAVEAAEKEAIRTRNDKQALQALRHKLRLDSMVAKARNALDEAIRINAEGKRGGAKLVEQRESDLNNLLSRQDSILSSVPGVRQRDAKFRGLTIAQKMAEVDNLLPDSDKRTAAANAAAEDARRKMAAFERSNPAPKNDEDRQAAAQAALIAARKKEAIRLTGAADSLTMVLQEAQRAVAELGSSDKGEDGRMNIATFQNENEKRMLVEKRAILQRDAQKSESQYAADLSKITNEANPLFSRMALASSQINKLRNETDKAKQSIRAAQETARRNQESAYAEQRRIDSMAAARQQEISSLTAQVRKIQQDSTALAQQQGSRSYSSSPADLIRSYTNLSQEIQSLRRQQDSIQQTMAAQSGRQQEMIRNVSLQISSVNRAIESASREIASLNAARSAAFTRQEQERQAQIARQESQRRESERTAQTLEQEIATLSTTREKLRSDSIAAESGIRQAVQKAQSGLMEQDNTLSGRNRELSGLIDENNRARSDSARIAAQLAAVRDDIVRRDIAIRKLQGTIAQETADRKRRQQAPEAEQARYRQALVSATLELQRQNGIIEKKKTDLARLRSASAYGRIEVDEKYSVTQPAPAVQKPAYQAPAAQENAPKPQQPAAGAIAQKRMEEIYKMIGDNRVDDAADQFRKMRGFLKINLLPEAFDALKTTIESMGGNAK